MNGPGFSSDDAAVPMEDAGFSPPPPLLTTASRSAMSVTSQRPAVQSRAGKKQDMSFGVYPVCFLNACELLWDNPLLRFRIQF